KIDARFTLAQGHFRLHPLGNFPADSLEFDDAPFLIDDGIVDPLLPADVAVGHDDCMLVRHSAAVSGEAGYASGNFIAPALGDEFEELQPDQFLALSPKEPAIGFIHKGKSCVGKIT